MSIMEMELYKENNYSNYSNFYNGDQESFQSFNEILGDLSLNLSLSKISKSKFAEPFNFLCNKCNNVSIIRFINKNKIKYICKCEDSPKDIFIKDIYNYLSQEIETEIEYKLKCTNHPDEKFIFFCEVCQKNLCNKCLDNCMEHKNGIKNLVYDIDTINKFNYINEKIKSKNQVLIDEDNNFLNFEDEEINEEKYKLIHTSDNKYFAQKLNKDINTNIENKEDFNKILDEHNNSKILEEEYYFINLFTIIIYDYQNFPNKNHIETISNIEKFVILYFGEFNEIILKYKFEEKDIKNNCVELFGEEFIKKNNEKCFLIINEKIMELNSTINLSNIFENNENFLIFIPFELEVKLIENIK